MIARRLALGAAAATSLFNERVQALSAAAKSNAVPPAAPRRPKEVIFGKVQCLLHSVVGLMWPCEEACSASLTRVHIDDYILDRATIWCAVRSTCSRSSQIDLLMHFENLLNLNIFNLKIG